MKIKSLICVLIAFQLLFPAFGCGPAGHRQSLDGTDEGTARIKGTRVFIGLFSKHVHIVMLDDKEVAGNEAVILPGPHKVHVRIGETDTLAIPAPAIAVAGVANRIIKSAFI